MEEKAASEIILALLLISISVLAFDIQPAEAGSADYKVGVDVGYRIDYEISVTWESDDPNASIPQYLLDAQQLVFFSHIVQSVSGTNITFDRIMYFENGTETSYTYWIDVNDGHGSGYLSFISANLSVGDTIYNVPWQAVINETITRTYLGEPVEVNHVNDTTSNGYFMWVDTYWNRATGVIYEHYMDHTNYVTKGEETYATRITEWIYPIGVSTHLLPRTIDEMKTKIQEFGSKGEIDNQGMVKSLIVKLNAAQKLADKGKIDEAKGVLEDDFIPQVQNLSGTHITAEATDILIQSAEYIIYRL